MSLKQSLSFELGLLTASRSEAGVGWGRCYHHFPLKFATGIKGCELLKLCLSKSYLFYLHTLLGLYCVSHNLDD